MEKDSTLTVTDGSSIDGNTAGTVSSPESLSTPSSWLFRRGEINARSLRKRKIAMLEPGGVTAVVRAFRSQEGGGAYVFEESTLSVTDGSSIDNNTAGSVRSAASLSPLGSWLIRQSAFVARSLRKIYSVWF